MDLDVQILSDNIRSLLKARQQKQSDLAEKSNLAVSTIKKILTKQHQPKIETIRKIAEALDVSILDLIYKPKSLENVRFRSRKNMHARAYIIGQLAEWIENFNFLEELLEEKREVADFLLENNFSKTDPVEVAKKTRELFGLSEGEIIYDICGLLEKFGVKIKICNFNVTGFYGISIGNKDGGPAIIINTYNSTVERQIFSVAHELGHILMHLGGFDEKINLVEEEEENQADKFAAHFLMPQDVFEKKWKESAGLSFVDRVLKLKKIFKVSYRTILYRLAEKEGYEYREICMQFSVNYKRKYNKDLKNNFEPAALDKMDFIDNRLSYLVARAFMEEEITISKACEVLNINYAELGEICSSFDC